MQNVWMDIEEFVLISSIPKERVLEMIKSGALNSKQEGESIFIDAKSGTNAVVKKAENGLVNMDINGGSSLDPVFVEKTINTILGLHSKILDAKEESLQSCRSENEFLKDSIISMQEAFDEEKKDIKFLREELHRAREEIEFMKRKYKLMWGKVSSMTDK